jgi:hypothetical protein
VDLTQAMYEATETPPPTAIDVDRLIAGEQRRTRGLRLAGFAAVVTVLAFGATMMPRYFGESLAPPGAALPSVSARPSGIHSMSTTPPCAVTAGEGDPPLHPVTETCEHATARLTAIIGEKLRAELGEDWPAPRFVRTSAAAVGYLVSWDYNPDGHPFHLNVWIYASPQDKPEWDGMPCGTECRQETVDGMPALISSGPRASVFRADGTVVSVDVDSEEAGHAPLITEEQVTRLAAAPELTLYPAGS